MNVLREALPDLSWWRTADFRRETVSGVVGALLVIPQAITFSYLAGVAPVHGLYCAIFVGFLASLLGNSPLVSGPNTAVAILLGLTVLPFAGRGSPLYTELILALSIMVGVIQLLIWLSRGATLFRYFSPAAISGIKAGVGVWLITSAVEGALGLSPMTTKFFYEKFYIVLASWSELVNPWAAATSGITIAAGLLLKRYWRRSYIVAALTIGSVVGATLYAAVGPLRSQLELLGRVTLQALPLSLPHWGPTHVLFIEQAIVPAIAIAVLGLAQTLVISRDLKAEVARSLDLHKEVFAQGVSNTLGPLFSAFAGSGSFNRTSVALEMGARTPLSGLIAAVAVVVVAWALGPLLSLIPMPVIAGVLVLVGLGMIPLRELASMRNRIDVAVFISTLLTVIFLGLESGLLVAVAVSIGFFVAGVSRVRLHVSRDGDEERVVVTGNLFYASLDQLAKHLHAHPAARTVLDLSRVPYCDSSAHELIARIREERAAHGGRLDIAPPA